MATKKAKFTVDERITGDDRKTYYDLTISNGKPLAKIRIRITKDGIRFSHPLVLSKEMVARIEGMASHDKVEPVKMDFTGCRKGPYNLPTHTQRQRDEKAPSNTSSNLTKEEKVALLLNLLS